VENCEVGAHVFEKQSQVGKIIFLVFHFNSEFIAFLAKILVINYGGFKINLS